MSLETLERMDNIVTLADENNNEKDYRILEVIRHNDKEFVVLLEDKRGVEEIYVMQIADDVFLEVEDDQEFADVVRHISDIFGE